MSAVSATPSPVSIGPRELLGVESAVLDELPDGVLLVDLQGRVRYANRAFLEIVGRSLAELVGGAMERLLADGDVTRLLGFEAVFGSVHAKDSNVIFVASDGNHRPTIVSSSRSEKRQLVFLVARQTGAIQEELAHTSRWAAIEQERADELTRARDELEAKNGALHAARDELTRAYADLQREVASRERLESDLRTAQKLESIGQLAAGVAHEINTPMQYIGDNITFLTSAFERIERYLAEVNAALGAEGAPELAAARRRLDEAALRLKLGYLDAAVPKALEGSRAGVEQVSTIVGAMKAFGRLDGPEKCPGDINQAIRDTLIVARGEYKHVARVEVDLGDLPPLPCFVGRLKQVFSNLIVNAAHAIAETGRCELGTIRVRSRYRDGAVEISVSDDGCGIPESVRHRVFDQFFTTKPVGRGTGQGLAIARSIVVDGHGGTLTFETEVGKGTTFTARLPGAPPKG